MRRASVVFTLLLIVWVSLGHWLLPGPVERHFNRIASANVPSVSSQVANRELFIADLHADSLLWQRDLLVRSTTGHVDVPRLVTGGAGLQVFSIVTKVPRRVNIQRNNGDSDLITTLAILEAWPPDTWFSLRARAVYQARRLNEMAERSHGALTLIRTRLDLAKHLEARAAGSRQVAAILALEGAHALEGKLQNLDALFNAGVRMMAPTHFFDTDLAGSSSGLTQAGLTEKGREFIRRAEARHVLIDLAHASAATIREVTAMATRPVIVSHTGIKATCANSRNLSDDSVRAVAKTGGVIGIGFWGTAVCSNDARGIARAIRRAVEIAGVEHVSLGSDFDGGTTTPFDATGINLVSDALSKEGFREAEIQKIMGGNALRVLRETLPE